MTTFEGSPLMTPERGEVSEVSPDFQRGARSWQSSMDFVDRLYGEGNTPLVAGGQGQEDGKVLEHAFALLIVVICVVIATAGVCVGLLIAGDWLSFIACIVCLLIGFVVGGSK